MEQTIKKAIMLMLNENNHYETAERIEQIMNDILKFIEGQRLEYNRLKKLETNPHKLQLSSVSNQVIFDGGTLIHCAGQCDYTKLQSIKEKGIMSGDFVGKPEMQNAETFYCADFYRAPKEMNGKELLEMVSKNDSVSKRGPFNKGLANILKLAFIIKPNEALRELMDADMYAPQNSEHIMQYIMHLLPKYSVGKEHNGEVSAIPYGIPSNFISGIVAGDLLLANTEYMEMLNQIFPNCYILNRDGVVFYDPSLSKEENATKRKEGLEKAGTLDEHRMQMAKPQLEALLSTFPMTENIGSYGITYNTMKRVYDEVNSADINAYMVGGISSAIQANIDLYRQNTDIDLMVEKKDLDKLMECLKKLGYKIDDKRANLTENYVDTNGVFHPLDHELNANIDDGNMLGVGIFVFERKDGTVITNSYAYDEKEGCVIGTQKVMPEELFDLMYSSDKIEYKGTQVKCQSKEFTYLSKSKGTREKDKMDASVIEEYIGEDEQKRIDRIKRLQKRIEQYRIMYDKDGNVISSEKLPSIEDKIAEFISGIASSNVGMSNEEIKEVVLNTELVKRMIEQDEDIRKIMELWRGTQAEGDIAESARRIAHDYYYSDEPTQQTCVDAQKVGKGTIKEAEQVLEIDETMKTLYTHLRNRENEETKGEND